MCREAVSLPNFADATNLYRYHTAHTVQEIATLLQVTTTKTQTENVALVTIAIQFGTGSKRSHHRPELVEQSTRYFLDNLRPRVRKTDQVFLLDHTFHFALLEANEEGGRIVQERLWEALLWRIHTMTEPKILRPERITIGHSAYPEPCESLYQCLVAASKVREHFDLFPEKAVPLQASQQVKEGELPDLARKLGVPYLMLLPRKLPTKVQRLVSSQLAQELHCYPLGRFRNTLTVAMSNPQDRKALDRLHQETGLHIFPILAHPQELETALEQLV